MQQTHRDRFDAEPGQAVEQLLDAGRVERLDDVALHVEPLVGLEALVLGDQRLRDLEIEVVQVVAQLARDGEHVPGALGYDQTCARALAFDQRVGNQCRAVHDFRYVGFHRTARGSDLLEQVGHHGSNRLARIVRRGQRLADPNTPAGRDDGEAVGKRTSDIYRNAQPVARGLCFGFSHNILIDSANQK